jgi:hypothetical protein
MKFTAKKGRALRAGDSVEVRPLDEILRTLDDNGALDGVPFMPEMVAYCGKRFEVWRRADKTCDEGRGGAIRRVRDTVHLKELRCEGSAHGGCDAGCLFFWKEPWLKRVDQGESEADKATVTTSPKCSVETLVRATRAQGTAPDGEELFSCQATQVHGFSTPLAWWDVRQYVRDIATRNVGFREFFRGMYIGAFNKIQHMRSRSQFRSIAGTQKKTPKASLELAPGELVRIKSAQEISQTLDPRGKNAGLAFRPVMVPYCGGEYRVVKRVNRIISPETGKMLRLGGNCVILDGVVCTGDVRRFCPRMVYTYWRDIWLTRVHGDAATPPETGRKPTVAERPRGRQGASLGSQDRPRASW